MAGEAVWMVGALVVLSVNVILTLGGAVLLVKFYNKMEEARERERRDLVEVLRGTPLERDVQVITPGEEKPLEDMTDDDLIEAFKRAERLG